jgi:hypothetical protein
VFNDSRQQPPSDKVLKNLPRIGPFLRSSVVRSQTAVVPPSTINSMWQFDTSSATASAWFTEHLTETAA